MSQENWLLNPDKFLTDKEANRLREIVKQEADRALVLNHKVAVRDYFIIDTAMSTGLRVFEIAQLNCGDIHLDGMMPSLLVRKGKGGKMRRVAFNNDFQKHCCQYLTWKQSSGEPIESDQPLMLSSNTGKHMTTRAIQKVFKKWAKRAGLPSRYSIHSSRHTYACQLYKASNYNLRLVNKHFGHSRILTTQVYADVVAPDLHKALAKLYK